jgi:DNA-binding MarR family transcriptional regulator
VEGGAVTSDQRVLRAILLYRHINGHSPSMREIADLTGLSKSWVHSIVVRLWGERQIRYSPGKRRSIMVNQHA